MTWKNVPLKAGTEVQLSLEDALGDEAWSATVRPLAHLSVAVLNIRTIDHYPGWRRLVLPAWWLFLQFLVRQRLTFIH
jgi:hypothetical protein